MFTNIKTILSHFTVTDALDILLVAFILYSFFLLIKESHAYQMAVGVAIIAGLLLIARWGKFVVTNWLIKNFITYLIIAVIILFQSEIRRFMTGIGSRSFRKPLGLRSFQEKIEDLFLAVDYLSQKKIGALVAIQKEISLASYADRGTKIDAVLSKDLLVSLFYPHSPLHDGAVIIEGNKVVAAGCLLPLPASHNLGVEFLARTRHLAAVGLSQETDAAVIVVSEETGGDLLEHEGDSQGNAGQRSPQRIFARVLEPMIRLFIDLLTRNWPLKVLALVLAFLLWMTLIPEEKIFSEKILSVPLETRNIPADTELVEKPAATIEVTLRAPNRLLGVIAPSDVQAILNLERATVNQEDYPLNPSMIRVPPEARLVRIFPNKVHLRLEKSKAVLMEIFPVIIGKPKEGFTIDKIELNPSKIFVRGPESKFSPRDRVQTSPVDITDLAQIAQFEADLILPKPNLRLVSAQTRVRVKVYVSKLR